MLTKMQQMMMTENFVVDRSIHPGQNAYTAKMRIPLHSPVSLTDRRRPHLSRPPCEATGANRHPKGTVAYPRAHRKRRLYNRGRICNRLRDLSCSWPYCNAARVVTRCPVGLVVRRNAQRVWRTFSCRNGINVPRSRRLIHLSSARLWRPLAFLYGWGLLSMIQTGSIATLGAGFGLYLSRVTGFSPAEQKAAAAASVLLLTGLNLLGRCALRNIFRI
jgi:hypothetical protein